MWMLTLLAVLPGARLSAQQMPQLPMDPDVRYGKLENGLTYYVRANKLPENRVNFYIAQKVGSIQEEDSQRGLAHFLEHMCFNGTTHFPGDRIVKYCESIGVKFGENLNAYTSTDETVYNINDVPVNESNIDSCLLILHDWACDLTLAEPEIDKERGVIHEEWRMRSSAAMRIYERQLPVLYPGSKYGHRLPIGTMEVVDGFKYQELRDYYHRWYRPDFQGIIVVGDIDAAAVENKIKTVFASIKMPENPVAYEFYPVPNNNEPIFAIDKDKEQQNAIIQLMFKHEAFPAEYKNTPVYFAQNLILSLSASALNARLNELSQKADCPFLAAGGGDESYLVSKTMDAFSMGLLPKPGMDAQAIEAVMKEIERARRFGFNASEIIRAREEFLSRLERIYDNRDKQKHEFYTQQYVRHFLENDPIPNIETEFNTYKMLAQQLPMEIYSQTFAELTASTDTNFVVLAMYPEKEDVVVPTAETFKQAIAAAKAAELTAWVDNVKNEPLIPELPAKGQITSEATAPFGYTCWTLSNGIRVYFKATDFNDSEILFRASSFGGKNKIGDDQLVNLNLMADVINSTGLGNFTSTELEKKLAGKQVACQVQMGSATENLSGSSTPKDLRTLFELIYLRFQTPANDPDAYNNLISMLRTQLENVEKVPDVAFSDSITATIYGHNPRMRRIHLADLDKADYATIQRLYSERFNNAADFSFYFTGNINADSLRLFTETYLGALKTSTERETITNLGIHPVKGDVTNHFTRKMETPQANIIQVWTGELKYTVKNSTILNALGSILTQRYLKSIREEGGMAYSVGASGSAGYGLREDYTLQIYCPVKPALRDSALLLMEQGILDIAKSGVTEEELDKVKKFELKDYADSQKKNGYWQNLIIAQTQWGKDEQTGVEEVLNKLTSKDIQKFVKKTLLKQKNRTTISMLPENPAE